MDWNEWNGIELMMEWTEGMNGGLSRNRNPWYFLMNGMVMQWDKWHGINMESRTGMESREWLNGMNGL